MTTDMFDSSVGQQLQDAVTTAHETTTEFNDEIIKEHNIFELSKQQEMKEMLGSYADGHIDFYRKVSAENDVVVQEMSG